MNDIIDYISERLSEFFIITHSPYEGATDYNRKHILLKEPSGRKLSPRIHKIIEDEVGAKFNIYPKRISTSKLEIDLWDSKQNTAYEIVLGNGEEIWKDILKSLLVKAEKLVIFCRNYPDQYVKGYREINNTISNLKELLKEKLTIQIIKIKPKP